MYLHLHLHLRLPLKPTLSLPPGLLPRPTLSLPLGILLRLTLGTLLSLPPRLPPKPTPYAFLLGLPFRPTLSLPLWGNPAEASGAVLQKRLGAGPLMSYLPCGFEFNNIKGYSLGGFTPSGNGAEASRAAPHRKHWPPFSSLRSRGGCAPCTPPRHRYCSFRTSIARRPAVIRPTIEILFN